MILANDNLAGLGRAQASVAERRGQRREFAHVSANRDEIARLSNGQVQLGLGVRLDAGVSPLGVSPGGLELAEKHREAELGPLVGPARGAELRVKIVGSHGMP